MSHEAYRVPPKNNILLPMFVPQFWRSNPPFKRPLQQGILLLQLLNPANSTPTVLSSETMNALKSLYA